MQFEKLFDDPTEGRIINKRLFNGIVPIVLATELLEADKRKLVTLITLICKKLIGIHRHLARYSQVIKQESERLQRSGEDKKAVNLSDDLFLEYDEFLVQVKSALDHLVKWGLPPISRTLSRRPTMAVRSVHVEAKEVQHRVQARCR